MQKVDHNIVFLEKTQILSPNIAENCDHNIDPWFFVGNVEIS
jgi:hypothetical protein